MPLYGECAGHAQIFRAERITRLRSGLSLENNESLDPAAWFFTADSINRRTPAGNRLRIRW